MWLGSDSWGWGEGPESCLAALGHTAVKPPFQDDLIFPGLQTQGGIQTLKILS